MRYIFITFFLILLFSGCKTAPINQKVNKQRTGLWIEKCEIDTTIYKSIGKYKNGELIKKWRYYINDVIYKKERYRKNKCVTTNYHPNGTIESKGQTNQITTDSKTHWFYFGDWKYYDKNEKLISIKKYNMGEFVSETKIQPLVKQEIKTNKK